jgi:hypothetical protein
MPLPQLNSYPTHTRSSHPGWYSRLTYLHSVPEVFATWDSVNEEYYDMFADQFSASTVRKGNYQWPAGYWKPGVHQRIKGAFEIVSDEDKFEMTVGIKNDRPDILSAEQNNGTSHVFQTDGFTCLVHFEWNICSGPPTPGDELRRNYITIYGFYHYEDSEGDANSRYHHIPFRTSLDSYRCNDTVTWPYMLIRPTGNQSITLYNLTIEELGG